MTGRRGRRPKQGVPVAARGPWELWRLPAKAEPAQGEGWQKWKLVLGRGVARKANYWLDWSPSERRLARSMEARRLVERQPEVLAWVVECLVALGEAARGGAA